MDKFGPLLGELSLPTYSITLSIVGIRDFQSVFLFSRPTACIPYAAVLRRMDSSITYQHARRGWVSCSTADDSSGNGHGVLESGFRYSQVSMSGFQVDELDNFTTVSKAAVVSISVMKQACRTQCLISPST